MASYKTLIFCAPQGDPAAMHSEYAMVAASSSSSLFISYEDETWNRRFMMTGGTFSKLAVKRGGGAGGTDVLTFRKNSVDTALEATTTTSSDDDEDATDTVTVISGDHVSFKASISAARRWIRALFEPTAADTQVSLFGIRGNGSSFAIGAWLSTAGVTNYLPFCGGSPKSGDFTSTESLVKVKVKTAGEFKNVSVNVVRSFSGSDVTLVSRVNGVTGNISITIPAGDTGRFSDTTHADVLVVDDEYNFMIVGPTSGRNEFSNLTCEYHHSTPNGDQDIYVGRPGATLLLPASSSSLYFTPVGDLFYADSATDVLAAVTFGMDCGAKKFRIKVTTNTCTSNQVFTLMKNGIASAVTFTVTALTAGEYIDNVNSIALTSTDTLSIRQTGGGTGSLGVEYLAMVIPGAEASGGGTPSVGHTYNRIWG